MIGKRHLNGMEGGPVHSKSRNTFCGKVLSNYHITKQTSQLSRAVQLSQFSGGKKERRNGFVTAATVAHIELSM